MHVNGMLNLLRVLRSVLRCNLKETDALASRKDTEALNRGLESRAFRVLSGLSGADRHQGTACWQVWEGICSRVQLGSDMPQVACE